MDLLGVLQKTRPVLNLQLLLPQDKLNLTIGVVDLAVLRVDLGVQVQGDVVFYALARVAGESDIGGSDFEVGLSFGDIGSLENHVKVVALRLRVGRALGPGDWNTKEISVSLLLQIDKYLHSERELHSPKQIQALTWLSLQNGCARVF